MATVIDALVVTLGLDNKAYLDNSKRSREDLNKTRKAAEDSARKSSQAFDKTAKSVHDVAKEFVGLAAILVGANGIADYIAKTVTQFSNVDRAARAAGISVKQFSEFGNLIAANGGNAQTAQQSIAGLSQQLYAWKALGQVSSSMIGAAQLVGFSANDNALQVYDKFAKWAQSKNPQQVAMVGNMLGLDEASIDQAMQGQAAFRKGMAAQAKNVPDAADTAKVKALQAAWRELGQTVAGDANQLITAAAPGLSELLNLVNQGATKFPTLTKAIIATTAAVVGLGAATKVAGLFGICGAAKAAGVAATGAEVAGGAAAGAGILSAAGGALLVGGAVLGLGEYYYALTGPGMDPHENDALNRSRIIRDVLKSHGYPDFRINGMLAGAYAENDTLDPSRRNSKSTATGIGQLLKRRQKDYEKWSGGHDYASATVRQQAEFMVWELDHTEKAAGDKIRAAKTQGQVAGAYLQYYMRPGDGLAGDAQRASRRLGGAPVPVNIGSVTINTPSANPQAHAQAFSDEVRRQALAAQSNSGLTP